MRRRPRSPTHATYTMTALSPIPVFDAADTAALLDYRRCSPRSGRPSQTMRRARSSAPNSLVVPLQAGGVMLSMPSSARDLATHKLVNVCPGNGARGLPTILGKVTAYDATTGEMRFALDGPTVTGRRTAAITALGIQALQGAAPRDILLIGTGKQAANHAEALAAIFPEARLHVRGTSADSTTAFCAAHRAQAPRLVPLDGDAIPDAIDVVVTLTTSRTPVYREAAREADSWSASARYRGRGRDRREHGARQPAGRRRSGRRTPRSRRPDRRAGRLAARRIARRRAGRRIRPRRAAAVQERRLCGVGSRRVPHGARCAGCAPGRLTRQPPLQPRSRHRHRGPFRRFPVRVVGIALQRVAAAYINFQFGRFHFRRRNTILPA